MIRLLALVARGTNKPEGALVKAFLKPKAGILTGSGDLRGTLSGTPQGGILSPVLANIAPGHDR